MALFDCNVLALFPTTPEGPMKRFVADMMAAEGKNSILSLSLDHGFPWADSPIGGAKMLAYADGREPVSIGDIAVVRHGGVEIVLTSKRVNVYAPSFFTLHGVTLADKQVIGIKNLYKHTDVFAPLVRAQHYVATPGVSQPALALLPIRRLPWPMWPLDPLPLD